MDEEKRRAEIEANLKKTAGKVQRLLSQWGVPAAEREDWRRALTGILKALPEWQTKS